MIDPNFVSPRKRLAMGEELETLRKEQPLPKKQQPQGMPKMQQPQEMPKMKPPQEMPKQMRGGGGVKKRGIRKR